MSQETKTAHTAHVTAQGVLHDLQRQAAEADAALKALDALESEVAYAAQTGSTGDKAALREWEKRRAEAATHLRRLQSSIKIAERHVADADAVVKALAEIAAAEKRMQAIDALAGRAKQMDECLAEFVAQFKEYKRDATALGVFDSNRISAARRAIQTALLPIEMHSEFLPPAHRITYSGIADGLVPMVKRSAGLAIDRARAVFEGKRAA